MRRHCVVGNTDVRGTWTLGFDEFDGLRWYDIMWLYACILELVIGAAFRLPDARFSTLVDFLGLR